ncbi:SPW repeat domain-containing protein [Thalassoroseus pseudoceratinae]|uniref:SPW repeat domain-containing protein n=1 Tax=Thalassoroseus pseudoceratinae TaxID=2713176 RepID=UPI0014234F9F|nr:SPW repeat protein [Thalassoroseus pseudoceratinae]
MWSRDLEGTLGCWLIMSPLIFYYGQPNYGLWEHNLICGSVVILLAILSYWRPTRAAHWLQPLVGCWLVAFAYLKGFGDATAMAQNHLLVGLLLMMFGVIPNRATAPPKAWQLPHPDNIYPETPLTSND